MTCLRLLCNHEMVSLEPNSALADSSAATPPLKLISPGLLTLDARMQLQPDVASSWSSSPDQRNFSFQLRPNCRYHNGRPVTAESVVWNFQRLFDARFGSLLAKDYAGLESVRATASDQVEFHFQDSFPAFPYHVAWRTYLTDDTLDQPVGAGPFKLVEWERGSHLRLARAGDYYATGTPLVDEIYLRFAPDAEERLRLIEDGEVDVVENVPAGAATSLRERGLLESAAAPSLRKTVIAFNCVQAPFKDPRMRRAVALAVDRERLRRDFFGDRARRVDGIYPAEDQLGVCLEPHPYDPALARELVRQAGFEDGVRVRAVMTNVSPVPRIAARVAEELSAVGIVLDVQGYDDPPWWPFIYLWGPWELAFQGMPARPHPDSLFRREICSGGAFNPARYSNPQLDELVARARVNLDGEARAAHYRDAQRLLHGDVPVLPLFASDVLVGWRPGVRGLQPHPLGFLNLQDVSMS